MKTHPNHNKGKTVNNEPTLTDQSQASQTDINIIVTQFLRTGAMPNESKPIYGDFTHLPDDLRGYIEMGRSIGPLHDSLPEQLKNIPASELFAMTDAQILDRIKPADKPKEEPK